jgi:regulator of protease activity HflC (stomatin/prohibitin superfamily)
MKKKYVVWVVIGSILLIAGMMFGLPVYKVWQQGKSGEAKLREAEQSRQIKVQEALATLEAAALLARADTLRAQGVARSNEIIGRSITAEYLKWFWIENLDKSENVIYVPTEANIPIMEAGRLPGKKDYELD